MMPRWRFYDKVEFIFIFKRKVKKMSNEELMVMEYFFNKRLEEMSDKEKEEMNTERIYFNIFLDKYY